MQCKLMIWLCIKTAQNLSISLIIHYKRNHGDNEEKYSRNMDYADKDVRRSIDFHKMVLV